MGYGDIPFHSMIPSTGVPWTADEIVADGIDRYGTIQDAVTHADSIVTVGPGTYSENVVIDASGVELVGAGSATVIDGGDGPAVRVKGNDCAVRNVAVRTTAGAGNTADGILLEAESGYVGDPRITGVTVIDTDSNGIKGQAVKNGVVSGCIIESCDEKGIRMNTWSGGLVAGNTVGDSDSGPGKDGVHINGGNNVVEGNYIENTGSNGVYFDNGSSDNLVASNNIMTSGGDGVDDRGTDNTIRGNVIEDTTDNGVITTGSGAVIAGNRYLNVGISKVDDSGTGTVVDEIFGVTSGTGTLSSGVLVVDTGVTSTTASFTVDFGIQDPNADVKMFARQFWDDSAGTHKVEFVEDGTSANPTIQYAIKQTGL